MRGDVTARWVKCKDGETRARLAINFTEVEDAAAVAAETKKLLANMVGPFKITKIPKSNVARVQFATCWAVLATIANEKTKESSTMLEFRVDPPEGCDLGILLSDGDDKKGMN